MININNYEPNTEMLSSRPNKFKILYIKILIEIKIMSWIH